MAGAGGSPTARRWELAARLRELRIAADVTIEQAASELMCSTAKISRMETAGRGVLPRDVRDLCRLYQVPTRVRDELITLATEARKPGWWQEFRTLDEQRATFVGLESAASECRVVEALRMPGLLQTTAFTAALLPHLRPEGELSPQWMVDTVALRRHRQERVASGDLVLHAIIDEAALRRPVGGPGVMVEQIESLISDAARPNVRLQVVPFDRGPYPGLDGQFQHLTFPPGALGDVVFVEGLLGDFLLDKEADVQRYRGVFDDIATRVALTEDDSLGWLAAVAQDWGRPRRSRRGPGGG